MLSHVTRRIDFKVQRFIFLLPAVNFTLHPMSGTTFPAVLHVLQVLKLIYFLVFLGRCYFLWHFLFYFLNTLMSHYSTAKWLYLVKLWTWFWHMISEGFTWTKMSCRMEMQLFDSAGWRERSKWFDKDEKFYTTGNVLQPFEDAGEAEDDGCDVFCNITPRFTIICLFSRLLVILSMFPLSLISLNRTGNCPHAHILDSGNDLLHRMRQLWVRNSFPRES